MSRLANPSFCVLALALLGACSGRRSDDRIPVELLPPREAPPPSKGGEPDTDPDADIKAQAIDAALPVAAPSPLIQRAECLKGTCTLSRWVPDEMQKTLHDRGEVVIWEEVIADKAKVVFPGDKEIEIAGVVLEGSVGVVLREEKNPEPIKVAQWQGFRAPGGGVTLSVLYGQRARIALVVAVTSAGDTLAKHIERWNKDKKAFEWKERQKRFLSIDFAKIEDLAWGKGAYHARLGWDLSKAPEGAASGPQAKAGESEDTPALAVNLLRFSRDAPLFEHVHDRERECLAILEGNGELMLKLGTSAKATADGSAGSAAPSEMNVPVESGTVVCIPSGMRHAWRPSGKEAFFAIQVFCPPGPEQRFKMLAGKPWKERRPGP
jgi:mannose-6-phosphate isomerase-like protein (cupin superfamily)